MEEKREAKKSETKTNAKPSPTRGARREPFRGRRGTAGAGGGNRGGGAGGGPHGRRPGRSRGSGGDGRHSDFAQKVIGVRRVARVVSGGRRFSFSTVVVIGDKNGSVGVGTGKASDTALAIEKALRAARKNMITVARTKTHSLPHEVRGKHCSSEVIIIPARGKGLVAGSSVRAVLDLAGIGDVTAKILSPSKNKLNNARAAIEALGNLRPRASFGARS